jgi:hypothetical protein
VQRRQRLVDHAPPHGIGIGTVRLRVAVVHEHHVDAREPQPLEAVLQAAPHAGG